MKKQLTIALFSIFSLSAVAPAVTSANSVELHAATQQEIDAAKAKYDATKATVMNLLNANASKPGYTQSAEYTAARNANEAAKAEYLKLQPAVVDAKADLIKSLENEKALVNATNPGPVKDAILAFIDSKIALANSGTLFDIKNDVEAKYDGIEKDILAKQKSSTPAKPALSYGWHNSSKGWWYGDSKSFKKGWAKISGKYYWFSKSGYVNTHKGWEKCKHGWAYSLGSNGYYTSTTKKIGSVTYKFDSNAYAHKVK